MFCRSIATTDKHKVVLQHSSMYTPGQRHQQRDCSSYRVSQQYFSASVTVRFFNYAHTDVYVVAYVHMFKPDGVLSSVPQVGQRQINDGARADTTEMTAKPAPNEFMLSSLLPGALTYFGDDIAENVRRCMSNDMGDQLH